MSPPLPQSIRIDAQLLLRAYAYGVFPMAEARDDPNLFWIDPERRGILPLDRFHVPKRLRRTLKAAPFDIRIDTAFREVMLACAEGAQQRESTWINGPILDLYGDLFALGFAHSVECWQKDRLVGGLYGVSLGAAFFGESMFSRETDASKIALVHLVARLTYGNYRLLDTQFLTRHLSQFGAMEVPREQYRLLLREATEAQGAFLALPSSSAASSSMKLLQSVSQKS